LTSAALAAPKSMVAASGWKKALTDATLTIAPLPFLTISVRAARSSSRPETRAALTTR